MGCYFTLTHTLHQNKNQTGQRTMKQFKYKGHIIHFNTFHKVWFWRLDNEEHVFMPITYPHQSETLEKAKASIDKNPLT